MLYPLSYEGGPGQVSRTTRANRLGLHTRRPARMGRWPIRSCSSRSGWRPPSPPSPAGRSTRSCGRRTAPTPRPTAPSPWPRRWAGRHGSWPRRSSTPPTSTASAATSSWPVRASSTSPSTRGTSPAPSPRWPPTRRLGLPRADDPERVVIDYSHPNVAKEMHVGHLRTTMIGDALGAHAHRRRPHRHPGEPHRATGARRSACSSSTWSTSARPRPRASCPSATSTASTSRRATKFDADEEFRERARRRVVALQGGDPATLRLWTRLVEESTRYFDAVYGRLGVLLEDSDLMGESAYNDLLPEVVRRLDEAGVLVESDGAEVVFPPGFTNREGQPLPLIVRKGDGGFNYATTDLATVIAPRRAGEGHAPALRRRRPAGTAPPDGVRGRGGGRLAAAAGARRARGVRQRARDRPQDAAQPQRPDGQADRAARRGRRAGRARRWPRRTPSWRRTSGPRSPEPSASAP